MVMLGVSSAAHAENLLEIYQQAQIKDTQLLESKAKRDQAFEKINEARAALLPQIDLGAGLTGIGLIPGRPDDLLSLGLASSNLNATPRAGASFPPDVPSPSVDLGESELLVQLAYRTSYAIGTPSNYWTLSSILAYSYIPDPGQRPDLPAAHVLSWRLVALF